MEERLLEYAKTNMTYREISAAIQKKYNTNLSPNAIRKRLKRAGVPSRRGPTTHDRNEVKTAIEGILMNLPRTVGYRQMTENLRQMEIHVRRDTVMEIMREVDPTGVAIRRRRRIQRRIYYSHGPNHMWHVDGYDKLKPYGFPIHGCIDGFSRRIIWLNVGPSNNDPAVVATNYVRCVDELKGYPNVLQSDPGTENCIMGALQCMLRHADADYLSGINSYQVTRSVFNQRIEAWWSMMRRQQSEWWITMFRDMERFGAFHRGNENELHCIRYCFMSVLQQELDLLVDRWNNHYISRSRTAVIPNGRPIVLHTLPEQHGFEECLHPVSSEDVDFAYTQCKPSSVSGSYDFDERVKNIFLRKGWDVAYTWQEALQQYFAIVGMNI